MGQTNQGPVARSQALGRHLMRAQTQQLVVGVACRKASPGDEEQGRSPQTYRLRRLCWQPAQCPQGQGVQGTEQDLWFAHAQGMATRGRCKIEQRLAQCGRVWGVRHGGRNRLKLLRVCPPATSRHLSPAHSRNNSDSRNRPCSERWSWSAPRHAAPRPPCANGGTHP